jgi:hypothetical protein
MAINPKKLISPQMNIAMAEINGMKLCKCASVITNNAIPPKNKPKAMGSINQPVNGLYPFSPIILVVVLDCDMDFTFTENRLQ